MAATGYRFLRSSRLRSSRDFSRLSKQGLREPGGEFVVLVGRRWSRAPSSPAVRLGITASRRVGDAVRRNRLKRVIREWFRLHQARVAVMIDAREPLDLVVIARAGAASRDSSQIHSQLQKSVFRAIDRYQRSRDGSIRPQQS
jgi:ribonuclease P protein component